MEAKESHLIIRRLRERDIPSVKLLCRTVQSEAARDEFLIHFRRFLVHPYLHTVVLLLFCVIYYVFQLSVVASTIACICLVTLTESVRFYCFWKKIRCAFSEGDDLKDPLSYYSHPKRFFLVALMEGDIAGTVAARETDQPTTAKLFRMFVHPNYRRRGIASRLIAANHNECKKMAYASVTLRTHHTNGKALKCYEKAGYLFVEKSRFASLYPHAFDTVHYIKNNL